MFTRGIIGHGRHHEGPGNRRHSAVLERGLLPYRQLSTQELQMSCRVADAQSRRNSSQTHRQIDSVSEGEYHDGPLPREVARRRS